MNPDKETECKSEKLYISFRDSLEDTGHMKLVSSPVEPKGTALSGDKGDTGQENPGTLPFTRHISPSCTSTACEMSSTTKERRSRLFHLFHTLRLDPTVHSFHGSRSPAAAPSHTLRQAYFSKFTKIQPRRYSCLSSCHRHQELARNSLRVTAIFPLPQSRRVD